MSLPDSLVGDAIASVRGSGAGATALRNIAWLEIELVSGLKVEVVPTLEGAAEQLGLSLNAVPSFSEVHLWPGGPLQLSEELQAFAATLGKTIASAVLEASMPEMVDDRLLIRVWGAPAILVAHDRSLPQSLCLKLTGDVPSNKSLERSRDR